MHRSRISMHIPVLVLLCMYRPTALAGEAPSPRILSAGPAVTVVEVASREIVESVMLTGTLVARDEILVSPELDGFRIVEVLVEEGDRVERGQVLARLSRDLIDRQISQQDALIAKATAAVPQAQNSIDQAEASEVEARLGFERASQLMQTGNTTAAVLEGRTSALRQAAGKLAFARNGLTSARAELEQAKAVRDEMLLRLARTEVRAPESGIISRRTARVGSTSSGTGEPLFRIIARGEIEYEGEIVDNKLSILRAGQAAWIDMGGERISGSVRVVYPEVDKASRLGKVRVRLDADIRLRIGGFAKGGIETARSHGLAIPLLAVQHNGNQALRVLVVSNGVIETRDVRGGLRDEQHMEIHAGLSKGDNVVMRAGSFLRNGDRVRAILTNPTATAVNTPVPAESPMTP